MGNNIPKPIYKKIYPLRPNGELVIVDDMDYSSVNVYGVIIITGENRGLKKMVRLREFVLEKGRCPNIENDIYGHYRIIDIWPEIIR